MRSLLALLIAHPLACSAGATPPLVSPLSTPMTMIQGPVPLQETGLCARLDFEVDHTPQRVVAGEGSVVKVGDTSREVVGLVKPAEGNGTITLKRKAP